MTDLQPVLLSGGSGTRLWPLSREAYPKQFLPLAGEETMLQATWSRVAPLAPARPPIVIAGEDHRFLVAEQLRQAGAPAPEIVLEPAGRNTAPAIAAAALQALQDAGGGDPLLLVLPSDHVVRDVEAFRAAVRSAIPAAESGAYFARIIASWCSPSPVRIHPMCAHQPPSRGVCGSPSRSDF